MFLSFKMNKKKKEKDGDHNFFSPIFFLLRFLINSKENKEMNEKVG